MELMNTGSSVDRISDLPDSILGYILSFLPTKNAVATRILSQRWSFVWTITSNLDLDFRSPEIHSKRAYLSSSKEEKEKFQGQVVKFIDFVNYVLLLHKPKYLSRLSLALESAFVKVDAWISAWISVVVSKNVQELCLKIFMLPIQAQRSIFSCEGLKSLELDCNISSEICISSEIVVSFPRLEHLKLISIYFQSEEAFNKLIDGCPVLKYLFIDMISVELKSRSGNNNIVNGIEFKCTISSTSLTHLELFACYSFVANGEPVGIQLETPSLEYIKLTQVSRIFIRHSLTSLVEANIYLASRKSEYFEEQNNCSSVVEAIHAFNCAKTLTISAHVIRALGHATIKMTTKFKRLTRLEVTLSSNHWSALQDLISLSDSLEVVTIKKGYDPTADNVNNSNWKQPDLVPACLSNSLRTVSIDAYDGHYDELAMVAYILKHGSVLQLMQICFKQSISDFKTKFELVQKISKLPRKSPDCEVDFC